MTGWVFSSVSGAPCDGWLASYKQLELDQLPNGRSWSNTPARRYVLSPASVGEATHLDFRATGLDSGNNLENLHCNIRMLYCALCIHDYQYNDSFWNIWFWLVNRGLFSYVNCEPGPQKQSCSRVYLQQFIVWVKIIEFSFMSKIIRILIKDNVPWRYLVNVLP